MRRAPAIWFPTIRTGTGTDVYTERLVNGLHQRGIRAEISWLPLRAEFAPWTVDVPRAPTWASIVHVNTWLHTRFLPFGIPIIATVHHAVHHPDAQAYKGIAQTFYHREWIAPNERRILHSAANVVAVSEFVAESTRLTLSNVPMQVIHNGVDINAFCPPVSPREPQKPFRLLYVGSWIARKGVDLLPKILRELGEDFELHYTGGRATSREKHRMPPNMKDVGRLDSPLAVAAAMRSADALLLPSLSEGHPLVAIEAMACGLPVIGTHGTSIAEAVSDGKTGILCARNDASAFAEAARKLRADKTQYNTLTRTARNEAEERFSERQMLDAYLRLYEKIALYS